MNTDHSNKSGVFWICIQKKNFFYLIALDLKVLNSSLCKTIKNLSTKFYWYKKVKKKDGKITLITLKISMGAYEGIKSAHRLSTTTVDLLHLMNGYGKLHKIKDKIMVHLTDDQLQRLNTDTCGIFQRYFYLNLFTPIDGRSVIQDKTLSKPTIEKLLNEIFSLDRDSNEKLIEQFAEEQEIRKREYSYSLNL